MLVVTTTAVLGLPLGAPEAACSTATPNHIAVPNMATGSVPYDVDISSLDGGYEPGKAYTIK